MGTHCSSELDRGHIFKSKTTTMKLLLLTVFVAGAFATEGAAKAEEPAAPVAVAPVHHGLRPFYGLWGHQQGWPGFVAPGFSSQCFGCRGKSPLRLMPNLDITDILMDTPLPMVMDTDMLSPDTATLMSAASWERGQLRLMPNLDITDILMDMDITDAPIIMDTVLSDLESLDMLAVEPLLLPEVPKASANKTAILWCSLNCCSDDCHFLMIFIN